MKGWNFIADDLEEFDLDLESRLTWWLWREIMYILEWEVPWA